MGDATFCLGKMVLRSTHMENFLAQKSMSATRGAYDAKQKAVSAKDSLDMLGQKAVSATRGEILRAQKALRAKRGARCAGRYNGIAADTGSMRALFEMTLAALLSGHPWRSETPASRCGCGGDVLAHCAGRLQRTNDPQEGECGLDPAQL
ncbi:MAG: hypothetical protein WCI05_08205 [Myxococcales bacterium]